MACQECHGLGTTSINCAQSMPHIVGKWAKRLCGGGSSAAGQVQHLCREHVLDYFNSVSTSVRNIEQHSHGNRKRASGCCNL